MGNHIEAPNCLGSINLESRKPSTLPNDGPHSHLFQVEDGVNLNRAEQRHLFAARERLLRELMTTAGLDDKGPVREQLLTLFDLLQSPFLQSNENLFFLRKQGLIPQDVGDLRIALSYVLSNNIKDVHQFRKFLSQKQPLALNLVDYLRKPSILSTESTLCHALGELQIHQTLLSLQSIFPELNLEPSVLEMIRERVEKGDSPAFSTALMLLTQAARLLADHDPHLNTILRPLAEFRVVVYQYCQAGGKVSFEEIYQLFDAARKLKAVEPGIEKTLGQFTPQQLRLLALADERVDGGFESLAQTGKLEPLEIIRRFCPNLDPLRKAELSKAIEAGREKAEWGLLEKLLKAYGLTGLVTTGFLILAGCTTPSLTEYEPEPPYYCTIPPELLDTISPTVPQPPTATLTPDTASLTPESTPTPITQETQNNWVEAFENYNVKLEIVDNIGGADIPPILKEGLYNLVENFTNRYEAAPDTKIKFYIDQDSRPILEITRGSIIDTLSSEDSEDYQVYSKGTRLFPLLNDIVPIGKPRKDTFATWHPDGSNQPSITTQPTLIESYTDPNSGVEVYVCSVRVLHQMDPITWSLTPVEDEVREADENVYEVHLTEATLKSVYGMTPSDIATPTPTPEPTPTGTATLTPEGESSPTPTETPEPTTTPEEETQLFNAERILKESGYFQPGIQQEPLVCFKATDFANVPDFEGVADCAKEQARLTEELTEPDSNLRIWVSPEFAEGINTALQGKISSIEDHPYWSQVDFGKEEVEVAFFIADEQASFKEAVNLALEGCVANNPAKDEESNLLVDQAGNPLVTFAYTNPKAESYIHTDPETGVRGVGLEDEVNLPPEVVLNARVHVIFAANSGRVNLETGKYEVEIAGKNVPLPFTQGNPGAADVRSTGIIVYPENIADIQEELEAGVEPANLNTRLEIIAPVSFSPEAIKNYMATSANGIIAMALDPLVLSADENHPDASRQAAQERQWNYISQAIERKFSEYDTKQYLAVEAPNIYLDTVETTRHSILQLHIDSSLKQERYYNDRDYDDLTQQ